MSVSLTDEIRAACAAVASKARFVTIDQTRIDAYAASLPLDRLRRPEIDSKTHFLGAPEETAAYFIALNAINFGSGWWPVFRKRNGMSGYYTVASCLTDESRRRCGMTAEHLAALTPQDCTTIFRQDPTNEPVGELMRHFASALNDLGNFVLKRFNGQFLHLIASCRHSAEQLAQLLGELPYFRDAAWYDSLNVPFYKRAQLAPADLSIALHDHPLGRFEDLHRLTIFADNLVPHVLRIDGVLCYDTNLAARIDREELVEPGSKEEIELRACAVHACELIVQSLHARHKPVTAMQVDYLLWHRGGEKAYKQAKPRHRARSIFY